MGNTSPYLDYRDDSPFPLAPAETGIDLGQMDWAAPPRRDERKSLLETESNVRELARLLTGMRRETITDLNGQTWETPARRVGVSQSSKGQWSLTIFKEALSVRCSIGTIRNDSLVNGDGVVIRNPNDLFAVGADAWLVLKAVVPTDFNSYGDLSHASLVVEKQQWTQFPSMFQTKTEGQYAFVEAIRWPLWHFFVSADPVLSNREVVQISNYLWGERICPAMDLGVIEHIHKTESGRFVSSVTLAPDFGYSSF